MAKPKPSGNLEDYKNYERWSYRRWAWEFLRRSPEFRRACDQVKNASAPEQKAVANRFQLKKFKRYNEAYKGTSGYPIFLPATISSFTHDPSLKDDIQKKIRSRPGKVIVVFDLNAALKQERFLNKQLQSTERRLKKRLEKLRQLNNVNEIAGAIKPKRSKYLIYLRILDLLAAGKSKIECAQALSKDNTIKTSTDASQELGKHIKAAKLLSSEGYIYLTSVLSSKKTHKNSKISKGKPLET